MSSRTSVMAQATAVKSAGAVNGALLQRQCACGQHTVGGECGDCKKKQMTTLQRKSDNGSVSDFVPPIVHEVLRSPGQPLDAETRAYFEPRFGHDFTQVRIYTASQPVQPAGLTLSKVHDPAETEAERVADSIQSSVPPKQATVPLYDFSQVRIHADKRAAESAQAVDALAYTIGRDVVFGAGQYAPRTSEGRKLLAHELAHVVQQTRGAGSGQACGSGTIHRKVVLKGVEIHMKDRLAFLKAHKWTNPALAASVMEEMAAAGDLFDFADESELKTEIDKRLSTVRHMEESQIPGDKWKAFGYPFTGASALYGPRVNYAAREYWVPAVPDNYAVRKDKAKNKELQSKPRDERCIVYGDPCGDYGWKLSAKGQKNAYHAIALLFVPQLPHKRTLIHCDYLVSLVNFMSLADSLGPIEFNKRVAAFGADKLYLQWNAFKDLHVETFERTSTGEFGATKKKGLGSTQSVRPSSEADLVIGDHVKFFNHMTYDLINEKIGNAWRLENAVFVARSHGKDVFLGHGSGHKTDGEMREKLAQEFNKVAGEALGLVAMTKSSKMKTVDAGAKGLFAKFPNVHPAGKEWHIQGTLDLPGGCTRKLDEKLTKIKPSEVLGLRDPCDPTKMYPVERPIESAK